MTDFNPLWRRIVTDLSRTQNAIDGTLKKFVMLTADVLETIEDTAVSDAAAQPALERLAEGLKTMVDGRRAFLDAHLEIIAIKMESNLRDAPVGCVPGSACPWIEGQQNRELQEVG